MKDTSDDMTLDLFPDSFFHNFQKPKINYVESSIQGVRVKMYKTSKYDVFQIMVSPVQIVLKRKLNEKYNFAPVIGKIQNLMLGCSNTQHSDGRPSKLTKFYTEKVSI